MRDKYMGFELRYRCFNLEGGKRLNKRQTPNLNYQGQRRSISSWREEEAQGGKSPYDNNAHSSIGVNSKRNKFGYQSIRVVARAR